MKKREIGIFVCTFGILLGVAIGSTAVSDEVSVKITRQRESGKQPKPVKSKLGDVKKCWLCGDSNRSLMGYFRKFDDLGIICVNNWYVLDLKVHSREEGEDTGGTRTGYTGTGEGGCSFSSEQMTDRGISKVKVTHGEDGIFDVKKVQGHLCQTCLDKLLATMETYGEEGEPCDLCLVDFQTLELYPLQEHNVSCFIRDYYVEIDADREKTKVLAFYAPKLEDAERPAE